MHSSRVTSYIGHDGRAYLAITVKQRYALRPGAAAVPVPEEAPLHGLPEWASREGEDAGPLVHEADLAAGLKPATDVLLRGTAYSHRGPVHALSAALRVGSAAKAV